MCWTVAGLVLDIGGVAALAYASTLPIPVHFTGGSTTRPVVHAARGRPLFRGLQDSAEVLHGSPGGGQQFSQEEIGDIDYEAEVLPWLEYVRYREIAEATGLSMNYAGKIRRGLQIPHRRHWPVLLELAQTGKERAVILSGSRRVSESQLPLEPGSAGRGPRVGDPVSLEELEEEHIRRVIARAESLERAADILGIDTSTLWRRRKEYDISPFRPRRS